MLDLPINEVLDFSKIDKMHWNGNKLLSYNKAWSFIISPREAGKTTYLWIWAFKRMYMKGLTTIVIKQQFPDITDTYLNDVENLLNKFSKIKINLLYKKGSIKDGIVDVQILFEDEDEPRPFFRVIALSNPISRIKSLLYPNLGAIWVDEFIVNTRLGEKYIANAAWRLNEIISTFKRESPVPIRIVFSGNGYSLYNPYMASKNVPTSKLYPGSFFVGEDYVVEVYKLSDELRDYILERDASYCFDDTYTAYCYDGRQVNDEQIYIVDKQPDFYRLRWVIYINGVTVGLYRGWLEDMRWWVREMPEKYLTSKQVVCFNLNDLKEGKRMMSPDIKKMLGVFKDDVRKRSVGFQNLKVGYVVEEIFDCL